MKMVLQRDRPLTGWGWAGAGEAVTVSFGEQSATTKADGTGKWMVEFKTLPDRAREWRGFIIAGEDRRFFPALIRVPSQMVF
jgi:sialate O-acetylesterase